MSCTTEIIALPARAPGPRRELKVLRYRGAAPGPKAYIQAALHADEVPALLTAQHLREKLDALDRANRLRGEIVLVPSANPIGLTQFVQGSHIGRFELDSGINFNRGYPDLAPLFCDEIKTRLGSDAGKNVELIRAAARGAVKKMNAGSQAEALKLALIGLSVDADIVLDLHCDFDALLHLYIGTPLWPQAADLAVCLNSRVALLSEDSGGNAFDEANSGFWWALARQFPDYPIPAACLAATVELRGERDVSDAQSAVDADGLITFLAGRGLVDAPAPVQRETAARAVPLEAVDTMEADRAGVLVWKAELGDEIAEGAELGCLVDVGSGQRHVLRARTSGLFFSRRGHRWVQPGQWVTKVAGRKALPWRKPGALLTA